MERIWTVSLVAAAVVMSGCATSNERIVTRMAARQTACDRSNIEIRELDSHYAGVSRYESSGCDSTNVYECRKWDNVLFASLGWISLDPRPCIRGRR
ncbi:MAG TPA: hypothetical protein VK629_03705 [Steroidobacteraceae bacterium]|nr:hypothetical protein [Steroidobacteraceae bacterium]